MKYSSVTIIVPCLNEMRYISKVLDAIIAQDFPADRMEIFVVDGMSTDGTRDVAHNYEAQYSGIHLVDNPGRTAPKALNIGIQKSTGDVIIRMDAHCNYPQNYISTLVNSLFSLKADNVGAAMRTIPGAHGDMPLAISIAMSHQFGVGNSTFRTGTSETKEVDTVPFGCYRREVFDRIGLFDEELTRNQDDEFNARLIQSGGRIFIIGDLLIEYFARDTLDKAVTMFYQYGLFKPLVNKKLGASATLRQFAPPLFTFSWIAVICWALISSWWPMVPMGILAVTYFVPAFYFGFRAAVDQHRPALFFLLPLVFSRIHFAYGLGYLKGILLHQVFNGSIEKNMNPNR